MKPYLRTTALAMSVAAVALLAGCNQPGKGDAKDAKKEDATAEAGKSDVPKIAGLETEKKQDSYFIGMQMGRSLELLKDDIDMATFNKALKDAMAGDKKLLLDDKQAQEIGMRLQQKVQQKQVAKREADAKKNQAEGEKFLAENGKKPGVVTTASGLQYKIVSEGKGPKPKATDVVRVHYKGTLIDGKTFDSSYDRNEPTTFPLNGVIPGWTEGIALMPVGSKFQFWIPSKLGYGEQGSMGGPIGPNATLIFEVELLDIVQQPAAGGPAAAQTPEAPHKH